MHTLGQPIPFSEAIQSKADGNACLHLGERNRKELFVTLLTSVSLFAYMSLDPNQ